MTDLIERNRESIEELCRRYRVRRLEVFGSAAREDGFDARTSDVDFLVEFLPQPPGQRADQYFDLQHDLEQTLGRRVDLVMLTAVSNPYFLRNIELERQVLYAA